MPQARFTPVFSRGRAGRDDSLMLDGEGYRRLLAFVADQRQSRADIAVTLSEEGYWGPTWECRVRDSMHYCGSGTVVASILHDGGVIGCPSVSRGLTEGNIRARPVLDIWDHGFHGCRDGRRAIFASKCGDCVHWDLCEGGGYHLLEPSGPVAEFCGLRKIGEEWVSP